MPKAGRGKRRREKNKFYHPYTRSLPHPPSPPTNPGQSEATRHEVPSPSAATPGPSTATPGPSAANPGPSTATPGPSATTPGLSTATQRGALPSLSSCTSVKSLVTELNRPPDDDQQKPPSTTAPNFALEMKASSKSLDSPVPQENTTPKQVASLVDLQVPSSPTTPFHSTATQHETAPSLSSSTSVKSLATEVEMEASSINPEIAKGLLRRNRVRLVQNGVFKYLRDHLLRDAILTLEESDDVHAKAPNNPEDQMSRFVDILSRKSANDVARAFNCLKEADPRLYEQLDVSPGADGATFGGTLLKIRTELMRWYKFKMSKIHPLPWCEWMEQDMDHVYTNLRAVPGKKHQISRGMLHIMPPYLEMDKSDRDEETDESDSESSSRSSSDGYETCEESVDLLDKIFSKTDEPIVCLIEGVAGVGKSIFCRRSALFWSKGGGKLYNRDFDLVIILIASLLSGDMKSDIANQLFSPHFCLSPDQIYSCLSENPEKCLILIDGIDELDATGEECIRKLVKGEILRYVNVVLTGRPEASRKFVTYATAHLQLKGFTQENVRNYILKYFSQKKDFGMYLIHSILENELTSLSKTPFTTLLLCVLAEETGEKGNLPNDLEQIYHRVISLVFRKYVRTLTAECTQGSEGDQSSAFSIPSGDQSAEDATCTETTLFERAAELAYVLTKSGKQNCLERELPGICEDASHLLKSGILNRDFTLSRMDAQPCCIFGHRSIQEYLCAWHLSTLSTADLAMKVEVILPCASRKMWYFFVNLVCRDKNTALSGSPSKIDIAWNVCNSYSRAIDERQQRRKQRSAICFKATAAQAVCESNPLEAAVDYFRKRLFGTFTDAYYYGSYESDICMHYSDLNGYMMTYTSRKLLMDNPFKQHAYETNVSRNDVPVLLRLQRCVYPLIKPIWAHSLLNHVSITSLPNKECLQEIKHLAYQCIISITSRPQMTILAVVLQHDDNLWKHFLQVRLDSQTGYSDSPVRLLSLRPTIRVEANVHPETKLSRTVCVDCRPKTPPLRMFYDKWCPY